MASVSSGIEDTDPAALHAQALEAEWAGNYASARELHTRAADAGSARSHYQLGFLLLDGLGGARDVEAARFHLRQAADAGIDLALVAYLYALDDQDDPDLLPDASTAALALLELARRDLASAGDTIMFWSPPLRHHIQLLLRDAGYYRGAIDGLIGQGSLNALRAFARSRSTMPKAPDQPFQRISITQERVSAQPGRPIAFSDIDDLVDARVAFLGARVAQTVDGHWRVSVNDTALLDWSRTAHQPLPDTGDEPLDAADTLERPVGPAFQFPGKPSTTGFTFGMALTAFDEGDLRHCDLRVQDIEDEERFARRCETRVDGVYLEFLAENGPETAPSVFDVPADVSVVDQGADIVPLDAAELYQTKNDEATPEPIGERLVEIVLTAPLILRLVDN
ncbi:MAG: hypothetical protein AAF590_03595 [Pseudomonadota bacterium]